MASSQCALQGVIALYSDLAQNPDKDFGWDKGLSNARNHGYKAEWIEKLPTSMWDYCAAVGNPFELGEFPAGATVLDLGCGAGVDLCVAALLVGNSGKAIGVDITPLMVETARRHAKEAGLNNVEVLEGNLEHLPIESRLSEADETNANRCRIHPGMPVQKFTQACQDEAELIRRRLVAKVQRMAEEEAVTQSEVLDSDG